MEKLYGHARGSHFHPSGLRSLSRAGQSAEHSLANFARVYRMPVRRGKDSQGPYYQYGRHGTKYYYTAGDPFVREWAEQRATLQGRAEHATARSRGWR